MSNQNIKLAFSCALVFLFAFVFSSLRPVCFGAEGSPDYHFDSKGISRKVLENYLKRSITLTGILEHDSLLADGVIPNREDDHRLVRNIGAKFIGRAMSRWGKEEVINNPLYLQEAKRISAQFHQEDPDIIFQACLFEIVSTSVNTIKIPHWVFGVLGLPPEDRNFRYDDMLPPDGRYVNRWWEGASVPDISRTESKLWFIFLSGFYMEAGCDAFHLGQVNLMNMNDPDLKHWSEVINHIRQLAKTKTRRGWIILDAHTPRRGLVVNGVSLLDFNSFPLRIKEVEGKPMEGILEVGYLDSLYKRSLGCTTPSGWKCDSLPYLAEFDNFEYSDKAGESTIDGFHIWGYDDITWFNNQSEEYRNSWLKYAYHWLRETDPNGFLQMPVGRVIKPIAGVRDRYRANPPSESIPDGKNVEPTIKALWEGKL